MPPNPGCLWRPAPTKAVFAVPERPRRPASAVLIQMQTGRIALREYLATLQQWREEQLDINPCVRRKPALVSKANKMWHTLSATALDSQVFSNKP